MPFDCKKMHHKCHACCCSIVPFSRERWERNESKIVIPIVKLLPGSGPVKVNDILGEFVMEGDVVPQTSSAKCPFLNEDLSCNIYEDRPDVCRRFGSETHVMMKCPVQDFEGRPRSRQNSRKVIRDQNKFTQATINRFKIL